MSLLRACSDLAFFVLKAPRVFFLSPSNEPTLDPDVTRLLRIQATLTSLLQNGKKQAIGTCIGPSWWRGESCSCTFVGADITRGRQQQGAHHHSPGASFRLIRDLRRTVNGQLSKKRLTSGAFFPKGWTFSKLFFMLGAGEQKRRERRLKKLQGRFPALLTYIYNVRKKNR